MIKVNGLQARGIQICNFWVNNNFFLYIKTGYPIKIYFITLLKEHCYHFSPFLLTIQIIPDMIHDSIKIAGLPF